MNENVYFSARKRASEWDGRLKSREGASELLGVSVSSLASYELGTVKAVPVDVVVCMADLYNAPELLNQYCASECPIGNGRNIAIEQRTIESVAVRLANALGGDAIKQSIDKVLKVAYDGHVTKEEEVILMEVLDVLGRIDLARQELEMLTGKAGGNGNAST